MKKLLGIFVLVLPLLIVGKESFAMTNQQLVEFCQKASAVIDANKIPPNLVVAHNQCNAFLDGFIAGFSTPPAILVNAKRMKEEDWPICFPNDFSAKKLGRDMLLYVQHGGQYQPSQGANVLLSQVVFDLYTCK